MEKSQDNYEIDEQKDEVKMLFLGDEGVGKTAAIKCYVENKSPGEQAPTVFDTYTMHTSVNGK